MKDISVIYTDTDSPHIDEKYWQTLEQKDIVREEVGKGWKDYGVVRIFYAVFLTPKVKHSPDTTEFVILGEKELYWS